MRSVLPSAKPRSFIPGATSDTRGASCRDRALSQSSMICRKAQVRHNASIAWRSTPMTKVKVAGFSISLDGFGAGTAQGLDHPLGMRGEEIFQWFFPTRFFREMQG
jgi:hypothetical protein